MCSVLQHKMDELKEGLRQRDELIEVRPGTVEILILRRKCAKWNEGMCVGREGG